METGTEKYVEEAKKDWGKFRKWLSAHPLTGFWSALAAGLLIGWLLG